MKYTLLRPVRICCCSSGPMETQAIVSSILTREARAECSAGNWLNRRRLKHETMASAGAVLLAKITYTTDIHGWREMSVWKLRYDSSSVKRSFAQHGPVTLARNSLRQVLDMRCDYLTRAFVSRHNPSLYGPRCNPRVFCSRQSLQFAMLISFQSRNPECGNRAVWLGFEKAGTSGDRPK